MRGQPAGRARQGFRGGRALDLDATTPDERAAATLGVVAYAGRFEVTGEQVRHTIFTANNPNRIGDTQVGHVTLAGDDLTLTAPPDSQGNHFRIHWRRAAKRWAFASY